MKMSQKKQLEYELGRFQKMVADREKHIEKLKQSDEIKDAQIKAANAYIGILISKISISEEVRISADDMKNALENQYISWYKDTKNSDMVLRVENKIKPLEQ
jgi:hypothetical protein